MTGADRYGILDPEDPVERTRYERHFYHAYVRLTDNTLTRSIWDWDDGNQLLRARIPYHDQVIYSWSDRAGRPIGYLAVNVHAHRAFQADAFGFAPEPNTRSGGPDHCCEILTLMRTGHPRRATVLDYRDFVGGFAYPDLVDRGFTVAYATCTRRRLRPYLLLGAQLVHRATLRGEERFLLRWPIFELAAGPTAGG
ncbi:hypothetical protein ACN27F_33625 [Solwaraspora sp. WMMB335]|uniref:hypothetical protein n=1 Tax=Solwaraspora sp. WMMB335 TaxID=3404118 RepID=UPI003B92E0BE